MERIGKWIASDTFCDGRNYVLSKILVCNQCSAPFFIDGREDVEKRWRYCPRCGARMEGKVV